MDKCLKGTDISELKEDISNFMVIENFCRM